MNFTTLFTLLGRSLFNKETRIFSLIFILELLVYTFYVSRFGWWSLLIVVPSVYTLYLVTGIAQAAFRAGHRLGEAYTRKLETK